LIATRLGASAALLLGALLGAPGCDGADRADSGPKVRDVLDEARPAAGEGSREAAAATDPPVDRWREMVASEEQIHELTPSLRTLARSLENLHLPDPKARRLFDVAVTTTDLSTAPAVTDPLPGWPVETHRYAVAGPGEPRAPGDVALWRPLLDRLAWVEHASFGVARGRFVDGGEAFETDLLLQATARLDSGAIASIEARVEARWRRRALLGEEHWRIDAWHTRSLDVLTAPAPLFREVLERALPAPAELAAARRSRHEALVEAKLRDPESFRPPHRHFFQGSQDRHPGVSVVDVDRDGDDDVYVMPRWGPNQLLVNRGDGRFDERAAEFGLDVIDHSAAAVFADFDNDGDPDLFLGRTLAPSRYLENRLAEEGRFVDRSGTALASGPLPRLVSSISAVDFDADGWLDVYVSTYAAQMIVVERTEQVRRARAGRPVPRQLLPAHLPDAQARRLYEHAVASDAHMYLSLPGPPNVLLRNTGGGRFEPLDDTHPLSSFRNTYQATWADYDADGDADVYLAHDFSPNQLLRNEGGGRFVDVTADTGTADIGFGMGASWGDYDGDGREDLYVSNMYSKAGKRVTSWFDRVDPRFEKMARGNSLFRNGDARFEKVSGEAPPALAVEIAGWSWGGQWGDVSNDGLLDLFVLSGYYSAPAFVQSDVDI